MAALESVSSMAYSVKKGDCLWRIARDNYGLKDDSSIWTKVKDIAKDNNIDLKDVGHIEINQSLKLNDLPVKKENPKTSNDSQNIPPENQTGNTSADNSATENATDKPISNDTNAIQKKSLGGIERLVFPHDTIETSALGDSIQTTFDSTRNITKKMYYDSIHKYRAEEFDADSGLIKKAIDYDASENIAKTIQYHYYKNSSLKDITEYTKGVISKQTKYNPDGSYIVEELINDIGGRGVNHSKITKYDKDGNVLE